jgi:hypothetical protein
MAFQAQTFPQLEQTPAILVVILLILRINSVQFTFGACWLEKGAVEEGRKTR